MSLFAAGILGIVIVLVLIFLRMPIGFALASVGFFGVWVRTIRQTPRFCGEPLISDLPLFLFVLARGFLTN